MMDGPPPQEPAPDETQRSALTSFSAHLVFWLTAGLILVVDLASKAWVFNELGPDEARTIVPGVVEFRRSLNDGAVFGSFSGRVGLFIVASVFALGFVFYLFACSPRSRGSMHVCLALILAGALGNLYDRARMQADVITFLDADRENQSYIGLVVEESGEVLRVGRWPEADQVRTFRRSDVAVRRQGVVRDFIKFVPSFPKWVPWLRGREVWPWVFNVADTALVCGVGALLAISWVRRAPQSD